MVKKKQLSLFIFIDALGWKILRSQHFLEDVLTVRAPLDTVLGYSSTCIPTILTGKLPREHGHFSFFFADQENSPFRACRMLDALPHAVTRRGRVRRMISKMVQRAYGYTGYFQIYNVPFRYLPLFDYSEKRDLYQPGGINSGAPTIFDLLRREKTPFHLSDWRLSEARNLASLAEDLSRGSITFAYLYLAAFDGLLHAEGTNSPRIAEKIAWYDQELRQIKNIAEKNYDGVRICIFSDHGMTDTLESCDIRPVIENAGLKFGVDYTAMYDSTMARFWFSSDGARRRVTAALASEARGHILSDDELRHYGCDFPDRRYGQLFFLMNPGMLLCPSFMGETPLAGMHGYAPEDKDSMAMFASNVEPAKRPQRLDDIFGLMESAI